jgi:hypothetical protein
MGLRNILRRRQSATNEAASADVLANEPPPALSSEKVAELQGASTELARAAEKPGVIRLHACFRGGRHSHRAPAAVRTMAATLRQLPAEEPAF